MTTYSGHSMSAIEAEAYARFPRLGDRRSQIAGTLSGGEQQMLAMARGPGDRPGVAPPRRVVDGARADHRRGALQLVAQIARAGVSILVVEQFASTVLGVADLAAIMVNGQIRRVGHPDEVEDELSAAYLGG